MKKLLATIAVTALLVILAVTAVSCIYSPDEDHTVDYDAMTLIWSDEFDSFDSSKWWSGDDGLRRGGYWSIDQVQVKDGNMVITTEYLEDGKYGAGWYTGSVYTKDLFSMTSGYVEVRCKMPAGAGHWGAFWLNSPDMSADGNGTEIDVVESAHYDDPKMDPKYKNTAFHTIHAQGYGDEHKSKQSPYYEVGNDIYNNFNTYGVYWDENGYEFYVNGMRTWVTDFYPTTAPEFLWLSVEVSGEDPSNPDNVYTWGGEITSNGGNDFTSEFVIDYVRAYEWHRH